MVWDAGRYENLRDDDMNACHRDGMIEVWLEGKKLQGGYALKRFRAGRSLSGY